MGVVLKSIKHQGKTFSSFTYVEEAVQYKIYFTTTIIYYVFFIKQVRPIQLSYRLVLNNANKQKMEKDNKYQ